MRIALMAAAFVAACSSPRPSTETARVGEGVVNGVPSTSAQDAVVMVLTSDQMCSGTLIAPNLVLTARHCVANMDDNGNLHGDLTPSALSVAVGVHTSPENANVVARGSKIIDD